MVGFRDDKILLMPLGTLGIGPGSELSATGTTAKGHVGMELQGTCFKRTREPIDEKAE